MGINGFYVYATIMIWKKSIKTCLVYEINYIRYWGIGTFRHLSMRDNRDYKRPKTARPNF